MLEDIDHVHGRDCLPLGMLRVRDGVMDHILQEDLQHAMHLLVDELQGVLHAAEPRGGWLAW